MTELSKICKYEKFELFKKCKLFESLNSSKSANFKNLSKNLGTGTHKEEILVNEPIKTQRSNESANQNTPKHQIFLIFFLLRNISMEAHAVHRDWKSYVTPTMDRRSAKTDR